MTTENLKTCAKCNKERPLNEMIGCGFRGVTTYECIDEQNCLSKERLQNIEREKQKKIDMDERQKYIHLPKEEQLKQRYNVEFDDLEELKMRFRDASIHYRHKESDTTYSWCFSGNYWYQTSIKL